MRETTFFAAVAGALFAGAATASPLYLRQSNNSCRAIPGDLSWPSLSAWNQLNQSVDGRLISTVPLAAPCHTGAFGFENYDAELCSSLQTDWNAPMTYEPVAGAIMNPYYQNQSCDPFTTYEQSCELGQIVSYSIAVSRADDVVAGVQFAAANNVRLVIKNTGHDFTGKSTGTGGLALWTHNLKDYTVFDSYNGTGNYTGPAIQLGAGMAGYDAYDAAHAHGYRVVGGDCPTVGIAGGYTQGGGHSLLNSAYGMAADQVLEWDVVTANGTRVTASPYENQDLYWALGGGGGGTYGVVLSMTVKVYPESIVGGAQLSFNTTANSNDTYMAALNAWWLAQPAIVDAGVTILWAIEQGIFFLEGTTAPGLTADQVGQLYAPYLSTLEQLGIQYTFSTNEYPTYYDHFNALAGPLPYGNYPGTYIENSRLIPRSILADNSSIATLTQTMVDAVNTDNAEAGYRFGCQSLNVADVPAHPDNAVLPFWRESIAICINIALWDWSIPFDDMLARKAHIGETIASAMEAATPDFGAYLNEVDPLAYPQADTAKWQHDLFGSNYDRLRQIKSAWDPESLFYANLAVGSEDWVSDSQGRLCRA